MVQLRFSNITPTLVPIHEWSLSEFSRGVMKRDPSNSVDRGLQTRINRATMKTFFPLAACLAILGAVFSGCATSSLSSDARTPAHFDFALIGDVPYTEADATNGFPNMIAEINQARLAFVVHDGDIKDGAAPCSDEALARCYRQFQTFRHPLIYVYGDNEWTDCGRGGFDPEERLNKLREMFSRGEDTLGQRTFLLERQSRNSNFAKFRENVRWTHGNALFVGLNIPGSNNNFGKPEFAERNRANLAWLADSFALATREERSGIMLIIQANPRFDLGTTNSARAGFNDFLKALEAETIAFKKPVVLVHGDTHYFRIDKPMMGARTRRRVENFTRVETFGFPDVHWLRATVDESDPNLFSFRQELVRKNFIQHQP
jgi:hypothetical protein